MNMLKKNKVFVGVLALLLALSVGYALFSETITINGTATAKGNFEITPTCYIDMPEGFTNHNIKLSHGHKNEKCIFDSSTKSISISTEFYDPDGRLTYVIKFTNTGTINSSVPLEISYEPGSKICTADTIDKDPLTQGTCFSQTELDSPDAELDLYLLAVQIGDGEMHNAQKISNIPTDVAMEYYQDGKYILKLGNSVYYYGFLGTLPSSDNMMNAYQNVIFKPTFTQIN